MMYFKSSKLGEIKIDFTHNNRTSGNVRGITFCDIYSNNNRIGTGIALCGQDDNFDKSVGRKISLKRALEVVAQNYNLSKVERTEIWNAYHSNMK